MCGYEYLPVHFQFFVQFRKKVEVLYMYYLTKSLHDWKTANRLTFKRMM